MSKIVPVLCLSLLFLAGCQVRTVVSAPFSTSLRVAPDEVIGGDGFRVILEVANRADRSLTLTSPNGCVTSLMVTRSGNPVALEGTQFACNSALTSFEFGPEETRQFAFRLEAVDGSHGKIAKPGKYEITAELHISLPNPSESFVITEPEVDDREMDGTLPTGAVGVN